MQSFEPGEDWALVVRGRTGALVGPSARAATITRISSHVNQRPALDLNLRPGGVPAGEVGGWDADDLCGDQAARVRVVVEGVDRVRE
jgi:hypothetical protein